MLNYFIYIYYMSEIYKNKYLKYKSKYINLKKNLIGGSDEFEVLEKIFRPEQMLVIAQQEAYKGVFKLGNLLKNEKLNLVTAESLTAGKIASTFVDMLLGNVLYGGFIVYDTDAKRKWINVDTPSVYSDETAKQMAEGALINSRAMVALAVTGNAMPYPQHADSVGIVDVGLAVRSQGDPIVKTKRFELCKEEPIIQLCERWKAEGVNSVLTEEDLKDKGIELSDINLSQNLSHATTEKTRNKLGNYEKNAFWTNKYPTFQTTSRMSEAIRLFTIAKSTQWAEEQLQKILKDEENKKKIDNAKIPKEPYDGSYTTCGEPTMHERVEWDEEDKIELEWPDSDCCGVKNKYNVSCPKTFEELPKKVLAQAQRE